MIRETGVVVEVENGVATISMDAAAHTWCGSCSICRTAEGGRRMLSGLRAPQGLRVGDKVTVEVPLPGSAQSAAMLFLVPVVLFVGALVVAEQYRARGVLPGTGGLSVLIALGLMGLWYVVAGIYDRHLRRSPEHQPRIVDRPDPHTSR